MSAPQFKIMLDLLEEYIVEKDYPFERIDGDITGSGRQVRPGSPTLPSKFSNFLEVEVPK